MATWNVVPSSDRSTAGWSIVGGAGTFSSAMADGSDSTGGSCPGNANDIKLNLTGVPGDFQTATAVTINVRAEASTTKGTPAPFIDAAIFDSGSSAIAAVNSTSNLTTSLATYNMACTLSGAQTAARWTGAFFSVGSDASVASGTTITVVQLSATVTYTPIAGGLPPEDERRHANNLLQGYRFVYRIAKKIFTPERPLIIRPGRRLILPFSPQPLPAF